MKRGAMKFIPDEFLEDQLKMAEKGMKAGPNAKAFWHGFHTAMLMIKDGPNKKKP